MDPNKYLILLNESDKTSDVEKIEQVKNKLEVQFNNSPKKYSYGKNKVIFRNNPKIKDTSDKTILLNSVPLPMSDILLDFKDKTKVVFSDGKSRVFDSKDLVIKETKSQNDKIRKLLTYWLEISAYTSIDNREAFLKREMDKIKSVNPESVLYTYLIKGTVVKKEIDKNNIIYPFNFNLSQKAALENALEHKISIIEGPPGTGKTQTILNIIANLSIIQGKSVAVVSNNNSAVQNVYDKFKKSDYHGIVASLGSNNNKAAFFEELPKLEPKLEWETDQTETELFKDINELNGKLQKLMEMKNDLAKLKQLISSFSLEQRHFKIYIEKQEVTSIKESLFYRETSKKIIDFLADHRIAVEQSISRKLLHKLKMFFKYGFLNFKKIENDEMKVILNLQRKYYDLKIEELTFKQKKIENVLDSQDFSNIVKVHKDLSEKLFRKKVNEKYKEKKDTKYTAINYKNNFEKFIQTYPIILSTTHSLKNSIPKDFLFDYVIIDESSQVDLLTAVLAMSCCKNLIIVGDIKQLPQIVDETIKQKITWLDDVEEPYDYFLHNIMSSVISLYGDNVPKNILKEHYRCHPRIIEFCNQQYYDGQLIPFTSEKDEDFPLMLYRTSKGNHMRKITSANNNGRYNQRELDVIFEEILKSPIASGWINNEIGVITPYRRQVYKAQGLLDNDIEIDTVHKFQGREKSTIIMSTVLDNSKSGRGNIEFVDDPHLINVAVSRAKNQFILVTDESVFSQHSKELRDLIRYIEYNALDENLVNSDLVSIFDLLYRDYSKKLTTLKKQLKSISKYQSENLMWTLILEELKQPQFKGLKVTSQVLLKNIIGEKKLLTDEEQTFVKNSSSLDFVFYNKLNKKPILAVEVDGVAYHENRDKQLKRDEMKNNILEKYNLPLIRFATNGSNERKKLSEKLLELLNKAKD